MNKKPVLFLIALGALAVLLALLTGPRGDGLEPGRSGAAPGGERLASELDPAAPELERSPLAAQLPEAEEARPEDARPGETLEAPYDGPWLEVAGQVLEGRTEEPVVGCEVAFDAPEDYVRATTDEQGRFALVLRADRWTLGASYRVQVTLPGNQRLFLGNVVLEEAMLIRARSRLVLRGRLETNVEQAPLSVQAHVPPRGTVHVAVYAGWDELDDDGRFAIPVWVDRVPGTFTLSFGAGQVFHRADVPTAELVSEAGALVSWFGTKLTVHLRDQLDRPVLSEEAMVTVHGSGAPARGRHVEQGSARFQVAGGVHLVTASAPGHALARTQVDLGAGGEPLETTLTLRSLGASDRLGGQVLDSRGAPVAQAVVSANPDRGDPDVDGDGTQVVRADENGEFELTIARDEPLLVRAFRRGVGFTAEERVEPGTSRVRLQFLPKGQLRIDLHGMPSDQGARAGMVQWLLVRESDGHEISSHDWGEPFQVDDLATGSYRLFVHLAEAGLLAQGVVEVRAEETEEVELALGPGAYAVGALLHSDGTRASGLGLQVVETDLESALRRTWGRATTGLEGEFRLLLGPSGRGTARVTDAAGRELAQLELKAGEGELRLP